MSQRVSCVAAMAPVIHTMLFIAYLQRSALEFSFTLVCFFTIYWDDFLVPALVVCTVPRGLDVLLTVRALFVYSARLVARWHRLRRSSNGVVFHSCLHVLSCIPAFMCNRFCLSVACCWPSSVHTWAVAGRVCSRASRIG